MAFDGVPHGATRLIAPYEYHPRAPITGGVLATTLRGGYAYSRHRCKLIAAQTYPVLAIDHARLGGTYGGAYADARLGNSWVVAWSVWRNVPSHHTHLVIRASMDVMLFAEATISARAVHKTTNGTATVLDLGDTMALSDIPQRLSRTGGVVYVNGRAVPLSRAEQYGLYDDSSKYLYADMSIATPIDIQCDVAMVDTGSTYACELHLQSNKTGDNRPTVRFGSIVAWTEVRDG